MLLSELQTSHYSCTRPAVLSSLAAAHGAVIGPRRATLDHLDQAVPAITQTDPPAAFSHCRAALDAAPGAKQHIFDAMPGVKTRDAINELTKRVGEYIHSGRHIEPAGALVGEFPGDQRDALFVYSRTKLLISQIYGLVSAP
jgi:hypothetical protein